MTYAAYGLYDLIPPAIAFLLLGAVALATLAGRAACTARHCAGLGVVGAFVSAAAGVVREAGLLGALHLSRGGDRRLARLARARLWLLARHHHRGVRLRLGAAGNAQARA